MAPDRASGGSVAVGVTLGFASGDHAISISLGTVSVFLLYFLTEVAGLRPALASLVLLLGALLGAWILWPWLVVFRVSWERAGARSRRTAGLIEGMRSIARNRACRRLVGLFLAARIAVDVLGAMFIF